MLSKTERIHEALIRFGADGRVAGMHSQTITEVAEDGAIITAMLGEAVPINAAGLVALLADDDRALLAAALAEAYAAGMAA